MREQHRGPEVSGERVPVVGCFDDFAMITSKDFASTHSVKSAPSRMLVLQDKEWLQIWGKCSYAHRQVDEQPTEMSKKNDDKSEVAMLKKDDWHENVRQLVVNHGKSHDRSGRLDQNRDHELKRGLTGLRSSNARHLGCVFQDMKILRSDIFAQVNLISAAPTLHNLRIGLRRRQSGKSKVPAKQRGSWPKMCST